MERKLIEEKVNDILIDQLLVKESDIRNEASLSEDLAADSLDMVEIGMKCESEFGINMTDDEYQGIFDKTVGYLYDLVEKHVNV